MANRYWVGGSGTWNTTSTTNWSASSGGASGASVPTSSDSVFFDQAGTYTVTLTGTLNCLDLTVSAGSVTFNAGTTPVLNIYGSLSLSSSTTWSVSTANVNFSATTTGKTINTNGILFNSAIFFNGVGGGWTLNSLFNVLSRNISLTNGTLNTNGFSVTCNTINITGNLTKSLILGTSTINCGQNVNISGTNFTFNAGTSTVNMTSPTAPTITAANYTFYNVNYTSTNSLGGAINSSNTTFNNLTIYANATGGTYDFSFGGNTTINGTLTALNTTLTKRVRFLSSVIGVARVLTVNALSASYTDWRDITLSGNVVSSGNVSPIQAGDCGGNTGITFPANKTIYWNLAGSSNWTSVGWASTSGGTPDNTLFPLPQDTAIIDNNSLGSDITILYQCNIGTLDTSTRTTGISLSLNLGSGTVDFYGNLNISSAITYTSSSFTQIAFSKRGGIQTITSNSKTIANSVLSFQNVGGTVALADALNTISISRVNCGTLNLNGYNFTCSSFSIITNTLLREVNFDSNSTITLIGTGTVWSMGNTSFVTISGTGTISMTSSSSKTFIGGSFAYPITLNNGGIGALTITGNNSFTNITNSVQPTTFTFTSGTTTTVTNWNVNGTAGNLVTINSTTSTSHTLSKSSGKVTANYLSISNSTATGGAVWYAGVNSIDGGNNVGWIFSAVPETVNGFFSFLINHPS